MNTPEPVAGEPHKETARSAEPAAEFAADLEAEATSEASAELGAEPREPIVEQVEREVQLVRSVRYGRVIVSFGIVGAVFAMVASALTPIAEGADYTIAQVVGFMALIGGVVGLTVGGIIAVVLGLVAKKRTGSGVAIQTDVR